MTGVQTCALPISERCVVITAHGSAENAVEALKAGAFDYLTKPVDLKQFRGLVASAVLGTRSLINSGLKPTPTAGQHGSPDMPRPDCSQRQTDLSALERLVGQSPSMLSVKARIVKVAGSMAPVLIQGESGTGKELVVAAMLAASGWQPDQPLYDPCCGSGTIAIEAAIQRLCLVQLSCFFCLKFIPFRVIIS